MQRTRYFIYFMFAIVYSLFGIIQMSKKQKENSRIVEE